MFPVIWIATNWSEFRVAYRFMGILTTNANAFKRCQTVFTDDCEQLEEDYNASLLKYGSYIEKNEYVESWFLARNILVE